MTNASPRCAAVSFAARLPLRRVLWRSRFLVKRVHGMIDRLTRWAGFFRDWFVPAPEPRAEAAVRPTAAGPARTFDDQTLLRLAAHREQPLFSVLRSAGAMTPLVVLFALLPAIYACQNRSLSPQAALCGLKSLAMLAADGFDDFTDPGLSHPTAPCRMQPPLMSWLTAAALRLAGPGREAGLIFASFLAVAGMIGLMYAVARRWGDARLALLSSGLLAFHAGVVNQSQEPTPDALGLCLALCCIWGFTYHWQKYPGMASPALLASGVALGLCLLASGLLAAAVAAAIVIYVAWWKTSPGNRGAAAVPARKTALGGRKTDVAVVGVLCLTAFAVGGWWEMMMASRYGMEFWHSWATWQPLPPRHGGEVGAFNTLDAEDSTAILAATNMPPLSNDFAMILRLRTVLSPLIWLALLGLATLLREGAVPGERSARRDRRLIIAWAFTAGATWLLWGFHGRMPALAWPIWNGFLIPPLIILAAVGLLQIVDRRIAYPVALAALILANADLADLLGRRLGLSVWAAPGLPRWFGWAAPAVGLTLFLALWQGLLVRCACDPQTRRRRLLSFLCGALLVGFGVLGVASVNRATDEDRELAHLAASLGKIEDVDRCTLVAVDLPSAGPRATPPQLKYVLNSLFPHAVLNQTGSWETALALAAGDNRPGARHLVVAWGARGHSQQPKSGVMLRPVGQPIASNGLAIAAYVTGEL